MLEIKIDLLPFGYKDLRKQIGRVSIWNDGTGDVEIGNYCYEFYDEDDNLLSKGEYKKFKRKNNVFVLLKEILNDAGYSSGSL